MKIDMKSLVIGVLLAACVFLGVAATNPGGNGKYSMSIAGHNDLVYVGLVNTENGKVAVLPMKSPNVTMPKPRVTLNWMAFENSIGNVPEELR